MSKPVIMHEAQALENLRHYMLSFFLRQRGTEILLQVTIWKVLHSYVYIIDVIVPAEGLDKAPLVLDRVSRRDV
jgi:hypothetical protein